MIFLKYGEVTVGLILILVILGQVVIPLWKGTPTFVIFRSSRARKLTRELAAARQQAEEEEISQEIQTVKDKKPSDLKKTTQKERV